MAGRVVRPAEAFSVAHVKGQREPKPRTKLQTQQVRSRRSKRDLAVAHRLVRIRDGAICVWCDNQPGVEFHHRQNRGMGGAQLDPLAHALSRLVLLCRGCHRDVGLYPAGARALGMLVPHGVVRCDRTPLLYRGGWVFLTDDGRVVPMVGRAAEGI